MVGRNWTGAEQNRFIEVYPYFTNKFLAVIFDRTELSIKRRAEKLKCKKLENPSRTAPFHENMRTDKATANREKSKAAGREKKKRINKLRNKYGLTKIMKDGRAGRNNL